MGTYNKKKKEIFLGKNLKFLDYRSTLDYKGSYLNKNYLIDDKDYIVIVSEWDDSEGWDYTSYSIKDDYPELEKMLEERKFEESVREEVDRRKKEYFNKRMDKYKAMTHEELVNRLIELEKDIMRLLK